MAYSDFSLKKASQSFHLTIERGVFLQEIPPIEPSLYLAEYLKRSIPLGITMNTEKARSELIITPILLELQQILVTEVSFYSGYDFTVDESLGLSGVCDYLISRSPKQILVDAPVVVVVEAKKDDFTAGLGQCVAEMVAAQLFNQQRNHPIATIYGTVTTGSLWRFLKLEERLVIIESVEYSVPPVEQVLGILVHLSR
jgi:hypothetical protein